MKKNSNLCIAHFDKKKADHEQEGSMSSLSYIIHRQPKTTKVKVSLVKHANQKSQAVSAQ